MSRDSEHEEMLARQIAALLKEERPRTAIVSCLLAAAAIAAATDDNEGCAEIMRITADHVATNTAVLFEIPQ